MGANPESLSPVAKRLLKRAQKESQSGNADAAMRTMIGVLALAPENAEALRWMGIAAQNCEDHAGAAECFRRALAVLSDDADLHVGLGVALYRMGQEGEALVHLRRACELAPDSASAWYNLAEGLKPQMQAEAAIEALQRALAIDPLHMQARLGLARAQTSLGRIDEAAATLREILRSEPGCTDAWFALADLKTIRFSEQDVRRLEMLLEDRDPGSDARNRLEFVLAHALEDLGDYTRAFEVMERANSLQRRHLKWDAKGEHQRVEAILRAFAEPVAGAPDTGLGREAIFIASLPRSGSTLVEQILASHPEIEGANEIGDLGRLIEVESRRRGANFPHWVGKLMPHEWQRLGVEYLASTARWRERKPRFTDKNLLNWMLAGAILTMLPAARVVIVRRDPVETCLGCYRQWFTGDAGVAYDLNDIADFYSEFWRLTRFWLKKFPDRVFDLEYETLIAEPEPTIRGLLDFCALPFDPACLEPHRTERTVLSAPSAAQVRQPLRRDTARADRYGDKLDGLRARLREAGLPVSARHPSPA
jgi:tetratricopeptide (TPR) repeat protein